MRTSSVLEATMPGTVRASANELRIAVYLALGAVRVSDSDGE